MHFFVRFAFAATLSLSALSAQSSSCDPSTSAKIDPKIAYYNESNCAITAMDTAHKHLSIAATAETRSNTQLMCSSMYSALTQLDFYREGAWRNDYKPIAEKVDAQFEEVKGRFLKTTCPQKTSLYQYLANKGEAWAMYNLGLLFSNGSGGVRQSDDEAMTWLTLAADKEYVDAYAALGKIYSDGAAFKPDYTIAFIWYNKAAMKGNAEAQYVLGSMYRKGMGVERDFTKAAEWYKKAIEQKHAGAKVKLDEMYKAGEAKKSFW